MNAGAFSDEKVVEATKAIVPVLVDCSLKGSQEELQTKYKIQGYPTVLYADSAGEKEKEMGARDPGAVVRDIGALAKKYPGLRPSMWQNSVSGALVLGKSAKKPVAVYVASASADLTKLMPQVAKDVGDRSKKFLWVLEIGREENLKARELDAAPAVVILDSESGEPLEKIVIGADDKPDVLNKALDEAAKKAKK